MSSVTNEAEQMIQRAVAGDEEALVALLAEHGPIVSRRVASRISARWNAQIEADDVMQVTYLEAFLRIQQFSPQGTGAFQRWLERIAENNLRDAVKELERQKRPNPQRRVHGAGSDESYVGFLESIGFTTTTPSQHLGRNELRQALDEAIRLLPGDYAVVLREYDLMERSAAEVAERLQRTVGAVYMLRARAVDRLRDLLGRDPIFFSRKA